MENSMNKETLAQNALNTLFKQVNAEDRKTYLDKTKEIVKILNNLEEETIDRLLKNNLENILLIILKDSNRNGTFNDIDYTQEIFSKFTIDIQKRAIEFILNNENEKYIYDSNLLYYYWDGINIFKAILENFNENIINENAKKIKETIKNHMEKKGENLVDLLSVGTGIRTKSREILDEIEKFDNPQKFYERESKIDLCDLINIYDERFLNILLNCGLERDKYALANDDFVSSLYQLSYRFSRMDSKFKEVMSKFERPTMDEYNEKVENFTDMSEDQFDKFMEDIKKIKICDGIIAEEYCDYLIAQKMNSNSILNKKIDKYFPIFKRAFEDKARNFLEKHGIQGYVVQVTDQISKEQLGLSGNLFIKIATENLMELSEKNMHAIDTMFHEIRHAMQITDIFKNKQMNASEYKMLKEFIIRLAGDEDFYNRNYLFMYNEIDARKYARIEAYRYLTQLGFSTKEILDIEGRDFFECYAELQKKEMENGKTAAYKYNADGKVEKMGKIFSDVLRKNPQYITKYPILAIEYDESGNRKSGIDILKDFEVALNEARKDPKKINDNRIRLIPSILEDRGPVQNSITVEDSQKILEYKTDNMLVNKYRDIIIKNQILNLVNNRKEGRCIRTLLSESEEETKENFNKVIDNLYKFVIQNPDEEISEYILECIGEFVDVERYNSEKQTSKSRKNNNFDKGERD